MSPDLLGTHHCHFGNLGAWEDLPFFSHILHWHSAVIEGKLFLVQEHPH